MVRTQLRNEAFVIAGCWMPCSKSPARICSATLRDDAYKDHPLPIGAGQTISQPYIVAVMLQHLSRI
jgi:hypothetical protein